MAMRYLTKKLTFLWHSRWLVLVASIWVQACAGIGYAYGSFSPLVKRTLNYNQKQISSLGVFKDLGDSVGLLAGSLCEILPPWGLLLFGILQNLVGYGWLWLIITNRVAPVPYWVVCLLLFVGTNGETYFNTAALVNCVRNFPKNRGPIVGILKGFTGLCGAIFTQIYATFFAPDQAAFIFIIAVGPAMVAFAVLFIIRPIDHKYWADINSESVGFRFIYLICLVLAAYLIGVLLLQDVMPISNSANLILTIILLLLLLLPLATPFISSSILKKQASSEASQNLVSPLIGESNKEQTTFSETIGFSEIEDEKPKEIDLLPEPLRKKKLDALRNRIWQAAAEGAIRVKRKKGPRRGQDFTLTQALIKADFWLLFFSLICGSGSGLTVIDNMGQIAQSLGSTTPHIFVSLISIWNFLGRLAGGQISEVVARDYALPRSLTIAFVQVIMAVGHFLFAMAWPGTLYVGTFLVGLGYGAHWAIVPANASELFGLKNFGILYNFLTMANPAGSLVFSGIIAGTLYDIEARKQKHRNGTHTSFVTKGEPQLLMDSKTLHCVGPSCFRVTFLIMTAICIVGTILSIVLSVRTKTVYLALYGKQPHQQDARSRRIGKNGIYETIQEEEEGSTARV